MIPFPDKNRPHIPDGRAALLRGPKIGGAATPPYRLHRLSLRIGMSSLVKPISFATEKPGNGRKRPSNGTKTISIFTKKQSKITKKQDNVAKKQRNVTKKTSNATEKRGNVTNGISNATEKISNVTEKQGCQPKMTDFETALSYIRTKPGFRQDELWICEFCCGSPSHPVFQRQERWRKIFVAADVSPLIPPLGGI